MNHTLHGHSLHTRQLLNPIVLLLIDTTLDDTLVSNIRLLSLQATTAGTHATFGVVHSLLKRIVLPAKDVIAVLAETGIVARAKVEGLRAIGRPVGLVVELPGVPDNLYVYQYSNPTDEGT